MTSGGLSDSITSGLLGVELGRSKVRIVLLDADGTRVEDVVEQSMTKAGGPRHPLEDEQAAAAALEVGLDRLGVAAGSDIRVGATIGFANCGVGSGPTLTGWLTSFSDKLGEDLLCTGASGVSYAPASCVDFAQRVFDAVGLPLERVELAPVAAARTLREGRSVALTLGSGVGWSGRILNSEVLEAFELEDGPSDEPLQIVTYGGAQPCTDNIVGTDPSLCRSRGVTVDSLGPSIGAAVGLLGDDLSNLLLGELIGCQPVSVENVAPQARSDIDQAHVDRARIDQARIDQARSDRARIDEDRIAADVVAASQQVHAAVPTRTSAPPRTMPDIGRPSMNGRASVVSGEFDIGPGPGFQPGFNDTYKLRKLPGKVQHSRELGDLPRRLPPSGKLPAIQHRAPKVDGIEAFAHPEEPEGPRFHVSEFVLGAAGMLLIVLVALLLR